MSEKRKSDILSDIYSAELPYLAVGNQIHIEMFSNKRLVLDGAISVMEYTSELICLKLKKGVLNIYGSGLCINSVTDEHILIIGNIISLEFEG